MTSDRLRLNGSDFVKLGLVLVNFVLYFSCSCDGLQNGMSELMKTLRLPVPRAKGIRDECDYWHGLCGIAFEMLAKRRSGIKISDRDHSQIRGANITIRKRRDRRIIRTMTAAL
jgi:hypothetical protein